MAKVLLVLVLASLHALSALALLMVSAWFIAISAIAPVNFNYMIPAVVVRALALVRIASGYGKLLWGHEQLLESLAVLRQQHFSELLSKQTVLNSQASHKLNHELEEQAGAWINFVEQHVSTVLALLLTFIVVLWQVPEFFDLYFLVSFISFAAYAALFFILNNKQQRLVMQQQEYERRSQAHFSEVSQWHIKADLDDAAIEPVWQSEQSQQTWLSFGLLALQAVNAIGLFSLLLLINEGVSANPEIASASLLILMLLMLNAHDWLSPVFHSLPSLLTRKLTRKQQKAQAALAELAEESSGEIHTLKLENFSPSFLDVSLKFELKGSGIVWLKGSSGSGKSSTLHSIKGLLDHKGDLLINGQKEQALFSNITLIEQFPYVLSASLRDNLLADANDEQLHQALDAVNLTIELDTWCGLHGRRLSGGEQKRLGLARALLQSGNVILIDEPFEALDSDNLAIVNQLICELAQSKMVIIASHIEPEMAVSQVVELD